jgi:iron complex transport system ATP-binding protein
MNEVDFKKRISSYDVCIKRGSRIIVKDLSIQLKIGELVGVLGANGAGKSTLLCALSGECPVSTGSLCLNGALLDSLSIKDQARKRVVLPQHCMLTFNLAVSEVVQMGAYAYPEANPEQVHAWVNDCLFDLDLLQLAQSNYMELSGGQQQRVQLARVLVQAHAIAHYQGHAWILLDEPSSSLDPRHQQLLIKKIHGLTRTKNFGVTVVMHDLNLAAFWCDRLLLMKQGVLIAEGCPIETLTADNLFQCFDMPMLVLPHPLNKEKIVIVSGQ